MNMTLFRLASADRAAVHMLTARTGTRHLSHNRACPQCQPRKAVRRHHTSRSARHQAMAAAYVPASRLPGDVVRTHLATAAPRPKPTLPAATLQQPTRHKQLRQQGLHKILVATLGHKITAPLRHSCCTILHSKAHTRARTPRQPPGCTSTACTQPPPTLRPYTVTTQARCTASRNHESSDLCSTSGQNDYS